MQAGITLAGYHIEKGARTFSAYAKAMVADLGEAVKPYLKSWYAAVSFDPRATAFAKDMTPVGDVQTADVDAMLKDKQEASIAEYSPPASVDEARSRWSGDFNGTEFSKPERTASHQKLMALHRPCAGFWIDKKP